MSVIIWLGENVDVINWQDENIIIWTYISPENFTQ
jgi:hypothetical protein